jgi:hypothetical protein
VKGCVMQSAGANVAWCTHVVEPAQTAAVPSMSALCRTSAFSSINRLGNWVVATFSSLACQPGKVSPCQLVSTSVFQTRMLSIRHVYRHLQCRHE